MKRPPAERRHLDTRLVLDYLEDRLAASARTRVEAHLAGPCGRCRERLLEIARLLDAMHADRVDPVPDQVRAGALESFQVRRQPAAPATLAWRLARLLFDSRHDPLPTPVRRAVGEARWLRYALDDARLEIEVEPETGEAVTIRGQLSASEPALFRIDVESQQESRTAWPDSDGRFALERVPRGVVTLVVRGPAARWRVAGVEL